MADRDFQKLRRFQIFHVFLPGKPINKYDLFSGRQRQMNSVLTAISQPGRHVILFGERGVGKTSLAHVLIEVERVNDYHTLETLTINCDESDDFSSLWHKVFCGLPLERENGRTLYVDSLLYPEVTPDDVRHALSQLEGPSLIAIDEIDQLKNEEAKNLMAATVKNLSDHSVDTTLILIGVADNINELIVERKSAERALIQVRIPRMSWNELTEIIDTGLGSLNMTIEPFAKNMIVGLSRGLPFYTHSFCLYAGLKAIDENRTEITKDDVRDATIEVVANAFNVRQAYQKATHSTQSNNLYKVALLCCAFCETEQLGFFPASEVGKWMSTLLEKKYDAPRFTHYLNEFCDPKRGPVLYKSGEKRRFLYRFADPLMQPYVLIRAFGKQELRPDLLAHIISSSRSIYPQDEELPF